jgi:hypothetical protein
MFAWFTGTSPLRGTPYLSVITSATLSLALKLDWIELWAAGSANGASWAYIPTVSERPQLSLIQVASPPGQSSLG